MDKLVVTLWITFGLYLMVLFAIFTDLWSGVRKAKKNGIARSSYGFKRTIDKVARYYNVMLALTVIDVMQMASFWYLEKFYQYCWPIFPLVTLIGAIGICLVEVKSIFEKAEDKVRLENVAVMAGKIITNKEDISEIVKAVVDYLNKPDEAKNNETGSNQKDKELMP